MIYLVLRSPFFRILIRDIIFNFSASRFQGNVCWARTCQGNPGTWIACNRLRHTRHPELIYSLIVWFLFVLMNASISGSLVVLIYLCFTRRCWNNPESSSGLHDVLINLIEFSQLMGFWMQKWEWLLFTYITADIRIATSGFFICSRLRRAGALL